MKTKLCILIFLLAAALARAQTNSLTALLQQGLFEEQANRNLDAAIADYSSLAKQFDKDRQLAATAVFRIGECYRMQGKTNEAAAQYERVLRDFSDQTTLATLSQQDLTGMGMAQSDNRKTIEHSGDASVEARSLAAQISGIEKLKSDPAEQARAVQAIFPDEALKDMLLQLPKIQEQEARLKVNPKLPYNELGGYRIAVGNFNPAGLGANINMEEHSTNLLADTEWELQKQNSWIEERVDFILGIQKARLKVLQSAEGFMAAPNAARNDTASVVIEEEDQEIARIQQMIQNSPDLINAAPQGGILPLKSAASAGQIKVATFLLDHGANINLGQSDGWTPLYEAANAGNRAMVELLLSRGAEVNAKTQDGRTPLFAVAEKGFQAVMEVLLANKADVNTPDNSGDTPLSRAAVGGHAKIVTLLLAAGANPNVEDSRGLTPLASAAGNGWPETVKLLLAAKADPNGGKLDAPLLCAIYKRDVASAEMLLQAGANPNAAGEIDFPVDPVFRNGISIQSTGGFGSPPQSVIPLWLAISENQLPLVQLLLKFKADPNGSQTDGRSLLFSALSDTNVLEALLDAGAKVDVHDRRESINHVINNVIIDQPLLNAAVASKNAASVEILLKHGANPNTTDNNGFTPLHVAATYLVNRKIFELLLAYKADVNVRKADGQTPLDLLKEYLGETRFDSANKVAINELIDLLRQHGALDKLPDWDHITVSRPSANFSKTVFQKNKNDWNQFTLLEAICAFDQNNNQNPSGLAFADLSHVVVTRPGTNSARTGRIEVNFLNATNGVDLTKDIPLEFGDVVEIPEREHTLAEPAIYLPKDQFMTIFKYLRSKAGEARLIVAGGQTIQLPLQIFFCQIGEVLSRPIARGALTSRSDLSRVKVTRRDATTGKKLEWIVDCSEHQSQSSQVNFQGQISSEVHITFQGAMDNSQPSSDLWLRDGDVIEVPEKP